VVVRFIAARRMPSQSVVYETSKSKAGVRVEESRVTVNVSNHHASDEDHEAYHDS